MEGDQDRIRANFELGDYARKLYETFPLRNEILKDIIRFLKLPEGSNGLDAGCGIALQTKIMAEEAGPGSRITGLDISTELLETAAKIIDDAGFSKKITLKKGSIENIPFDDNTFDWLISIDCAGYYIPPDHVGLIKELSRVVKSGGSVNICYYSSQLLLPGYLAIESRLNSTSAGLAPFRENMTPEDHINRAAGWFVDAGLKDISAKTFVADFCWPLEDEIKEGLLSLIKMRWDEAEPEISKELWNKYKSLTDPDSPDYILDIPDYYGFFTYTLFSGIV
ncbi:MAG: class I SAM-dependent methyltransferase [bacterium]|nr:class I SAM-dependent methyltransferase [bacterium]